MVLLVSLLVGVPLYLVAERSLAALEAEIGSSQVRLATLAASHADQVLMTAFGEVEAASINAIAAGSMAGSRRLRSTTSLVDDLHWYDLSPGSPGTAVAWPAEVIDEIAVSTDWFVSEAWPAPESGRPVIALAIPVYSETGDRVGVVAGLLDLTDPLVFELIQPAADFGPSGHADVVDERGIVVVSTEPEHVLAPGDHPDFYARIAENRLATVELVEHTAAGGDDAGGMHLMAYAPLRTTSWGVALGGDEDDLLAEVYEPRRRLRSLALAGAAAATAGALVAARIAGRLGKWPETTDT